jgi:hypothetical protein
VRPSSIALFTGPPPPALAVALSSFGLAEMREL